jgi:hypothetical protein
MINLRDLSLPNVRGLWEELVDRRLWPVAAVLLLALVAIPLLLLKSAPEQPLPAPGTPASAPAQMAPSPAAVAISDVSGTAYAGAVRGNVKNPFQPQGIPAVASSDSGSGSSVPSTASSGGGGASSSGSTGAGTPQTGTGTGGGETGTPKPPPPDSVSPDVAATIEFGLAGEKPKRTEVPEFTPLPSSTSPVVVYMGQSNDDEATFLVSSDVTPSGDGRCFPDDKTCSTLYLKPGDVAYLTAGTNDGQPVKYRLKFIKAEDED